MKRTLVLNDDDLIMVVDKDVTKQIDENRGEMNRTEFVNFLIQSQLKECYSQQSYVGKEEFYRFTQEMKELLRNFLDFILTLELAKQSQDNSFEEWCQKIEALDNLDSSDEEGENF